jgi:hypothetical protein
MRRLRKSADREQERRPLLREITIRHKRTFCHPVESAAVRWNTPICPVTSSARGFGTTLDLGFTAMIHTLKQNLTSALFTDRKLRIAILTLMTYLSLC